MSTRPPTPRGRPAAVVAPAVAAAVALALTAGCSALGIREHVTVAEARDVLGQAVGLTLSGQVDRLCELSPAEASTCEDTLRDIADRAPSTAPSIRCVVAAPEAGPLRNGQVVVLEGVDAAGDPYTTEFVVYDNGRAVGVLDAVWWSGLHIVSYSEGEVAWRFDSDTTACDDGGLPVGIDEG